MADVVVTITIPDAKVATIRNGILKMRPIPVDSKGTPLYTPKAWFTEIIADYIERLAKAGQRQLAEEAVNVDVTVTR